MADKQPAVSFDDIIREGRQKRRAEQLAQEIFGKRGRASAPPTGPRGGLGASLASRIGVTKRNGSLPRSPTPRVNARSSLHSRPATQPNPRPRLAHSRSDNNGLRPAKTAAFEQLEVQEEPSELTIKGAAAGPYTIIALNFAPGTTEADIEMVMLNVGGEVIDCRIISPLPNVKAEITFAERDGAQNAIDTFHGKKADGRPLSVYWKAGGGATSGRTDRREPRAAERSAPAPQVEVDDMAMEVDGNAEAREAEDRMREERRARNAHNVRDERDQRQVFPTQPRNFHGQGDRFDDRRPRQFQGPYQDGRYGFGGGWYGYRGAPRGGYDNRRFGGGQSWRP